MIIDLDSIGTVEKPIELTVRPGEIDLNGENLLLARNAEFAGETQWIDGKAHIRGSITGDIAAHCSRCLDDVAIHLDFPFDAVFVDSSEEPTAVENELDDDALNESLVIGGVIDVAEVVREQILLALPIEIYCGEDCKGLCPKCGGNRNLIDCNCADDDLDPRWAALKNLN